MVKWLWDDEELIMAWHDDEFMTVRWNDELWRLLSRMNSWCLGGVPVTLKIADQAMGSMNVNDKYPGIWGGEPPWMTNPVIKKVGDVSVMTIPSCIDLHWELGSAEPQTRPWGACQSQPQRRSQNAVFPSYKTPMLSVGKRAARLIILGTCPCVTSYNSIWFMWGPNWGSTKGSRIICWPQLWDSQGLGKWGTVVQYGPMFTWSCVQLQTLLRYKNNPNCMLNYLSISLDFCWYSIHTGPFSCRCIFCQGTIVNKRP